MDDRRIILRPSDNIEKAFREAGLLQRNITATWDMVKGAEALKIVEKIKGETKLWLTMFGATGKYKSVILSCMAQDAIKSGRSVIFGTAKELIDSINETAIDDRGEIRMKLKTVSLLIVDEVGRNTNSEAFRNTLFDIMQHRERDELQTMFATNMDEVKFWTEYLDEAFQRRCEEMGIIANI